MSNANYLLSQTELVKISVNQWGYNNVKYIFPLLNELLDRYHCG